MLLCCRLGASALTLPVLALGARDLPQCSFVTHCTGSARRRSSSCSPKSWRRHRSCETSVGRTSFATTSVPPWTSMTHPCPPRTASLALRCCSRESANLTWWSCTFIYFRHPVPCPLINVIFIVDACLCDLFCVGPPASWNDTSELTQSVYSFVAKLRGHIYVFSCSAPEKARVCRTRGVTGTEAEPGGHTRAGAPCSPLNMPPWCNAGAMNPSSPSSSLPAPPAPAVSLPPPSPSPPLPSPAVGTMRDLATGAGGDAVPCPCPAPVREAVLSAPAAAAWSPPSSAPHACA